MKVVGFSLLIVFTVFCSMLMFSCGEAGKEGEPDTTTSMYGNDGEGRAYVGASLCVGCHEDFSWSGDIVEHYLDGIHVIHSDHIDASMGPDGCLDCHDPIGDGRSLEPFIDPSHIPEMGLAAVGCENCHGAGGDHYGMGPMPHAKPDFEACGTCHSGLPESHLQYHPEANYIVDDYRTSPHFRSINDHTYEGDGESDVRARCSKCHSDEGARTYRYMSGGYEDFHDAFPDTLPPDFDAEPVQCKTCHDAHKPESLLLEAEVDDNGEIEVSAEFLTCTNCHQTEDGYHGENSSHSWSGGATGEGEFDGSRIIYDSHFDDPSTEEIEGYVLAEYNERVCRDCHNVHKANNTINNQWAASSHGNRHGEAWAHYDFKQEDRETCQRCHTTTGFINYIADTENYEPANNQFQATGLQKEMLYCYGCHTDNSGNRRFVESVPFPSGATYDFGDDSNLCANCHSGRESGVSVEEAIAENPSGPYTFINVHYIASAAVLLGSEAHGGYQYSGKSYTGRNTFGGGDHESFDSCVECHLGSLGPKGNKSHDMDKPSAGNCIECHGSDASQDPGQFHFSNIRPGGTPDYDGDGNTSESLQNEIYGIETALFAQIQTYAAAMGAPIFYAHSYPYFFNDTNGNGQADEDEIDYSNSYQSFDAKLLKAAYNYHFSQAEPHNYIHNPLYVAQILVDSLGNLGGNTGPYTWR